MSRFCLRPGAGGEKRHCLRLVSYRGGHLPASRERDRRLAVASDGAVCDILFRGSDGRGGDAGIPAAYQGVEGISQCFTLTLPSPVKGEGVKGETYFLLATHVIRASACQQKARHAVQLLNRVSLN